MGRNMHKYEELTPYEFDREKERASIIYASAGPLEYHEECNALGIDPCKGYQWCLDAARITGGIVFPMIPFAPAGMRPHLSHAELRELYGQPHFSDYTPTPRLYPGVFTGGEICRQLYKELLEAFAMELQFKLCVFIGSHAPAGQMIKDIVREETGASGDSGIFIGDFRSMRVMAVGSMDYNSEIIKAYYAKHNIQRINHGGLWEAAINHAINPEFFQPELLDENRYPQHYGALKEEHSEGLKRPVKSEFRKFTPEFAEELYRTTVRRLAEDVRKVYEAL